MAAVSNVSSEQINSVATPSTTDVGERCCENEDCNISKLVSMVPKRKTSQFVTEPCVLEKPMLINGFTTVFQLDGQAAKLSDLKSHNSSTAPKPVYRIKPNTHVHVINYVVVDDDGDALRKINESDPETMRKLLESQKKSAEMKLKRLMFGSDALSKVSGKSPSVTTSTPPVASLTAANTAAGRNIASLPSLQSTSSVNQSQQQPRIKVIQAASTKGKPAPSANSTMNTFQNNTNINTSSTSMQMPMKTHPNLKITAIASADNLNTLSAPQTQASTTSTTTIASTPGHTMPLITPVPLSTLQNTVPENNNFDAMKAEIEELRRTVAMLAEAQAKTQSPTPTLNNTSAQRSAPKRARQI